MMNCERCGNEMADNVTICPRCGTLSRTVNPPQSPTGYGENYPPPDYGAHPPYQQGYVPPAGYNMPPQQGYVPPSAGYMPPPQQGYVPPGYNMPPPQQGYGYAPPQYPQGSFIGFQSPSNNNDASVIVEVILSLFGIFGVGWLMAGETTIGLILLLCSLFVYLPILVFSLVFSVFLTLGFGLFCLGPLEVGLVILSALLLNNRLRRRAARFIVMQPPPMPRQQ